MAARLHRRPKAPSRHILLYLARQTAYISGLRDRRLRERHLQRSAVSPSTVAQGRRFSAQRILLLRRWPFIEMHRRPKALSRQKSRILRYLAR